MSAGVSRGRTHLVLIPGFMGFDVLGDIEYYAGTTRLLKEWRAQRGGSAAATVLHYFDNFPTAGVATRARLLQEFLAKRVARNEIQPEDAIVLIGHSTGGLDIRQLLCDLTGTGPKPKSAVVQVDGGSENAEKLDPDGLRRLIRRVVFLSVPQRGTNIANFIGKHRRSIEPASALLGGLVDALDTPPLEALDRGLSAAVARARSLLRRWRERRPRNPVGLFAAVSDVQLEMIERTDADPLRSAKGRAAHAHVTLWLSHVKKDFGAIDDLAYDAAPGLTPARFSDADRQNELTGWQASSARQWPALEVRSYATLGRCPFGERWQRRKDEAAPERRDLERKADGQPTPDLRAQQPPAKGRSTGAARKARPSDLVYRALYKACARGPFTANPGARAREFRTGNLVELKSWENDGIVNTASMLWPLEEKTLLVHADHGDVIGHFQFVKADPKQEKGRVYHTYDFFRSSSARDGGEFGAGDFQDVWWDIFDFAVFGDRPSKAARDASRPPVSPGNGA